MERFYTDENPSHFPIELSCLRIIKAKVSLNTAIHLFEFNQDNNAVCNRCYYAVFYAINAVHALDTKSFSSHKMALGEFNKNYIAKDEVFSRSYGRKIYELQSRRHVSDYDDYAVIPRDELAGHIEFAKDILKDIEAYCRRRVGEEIWQKLYGGIARTYLEESSE